MSYRYNYARGVARENQVADILELLGYVVVRSAGSKGPADLIAMRAGDRPLMVQVKSGSARTRWSAFPPAERAALKAEAARAGADAVYCRWPYGAELEWMPEDDWPADADYRVDEMTGCWEWQRCRNKWGYGQLRNNGVQQNAHRVYFEREYGPITTGYFIDHLCRNPCCVKPDHMEAVTPAENARRRRGLRFTPADVRTIKRSKASNQQLAAEYGVDYRSIWEIRTGKRWKGVGDEPEAA